MLVTVNGITAAVEWEGHRKSRNDDGPRVVIVYQVPFPYGDQFADSVMGGIVVSGGTFSSLPRQTCPTNKKLYALHADIVYAGERDDTVPVYTPPAPAPAPAIAFDTARVMVEYGLLPWIQTAADDPGGQQSFPGGPYLFANCEIDFATEQRTTPVGSVVFKTSSTSPKTAPSFRTKIMSWRMVRHSFPSLPVDQVGNLSGCVNDSTFLGQPRGCVLFDNGRSVATMAPDGTRTQSFEELFLVKPRDWNMELLDDSLTWDYLVSKTDPTVSLYPYANLQPLVT